MLGNKNAESMRRLAPTMLTASFSAALSSAGYCLRRLFPVAFSLQFEHISVMDQPVCCRHCHRLIHEDAAPRAERMVPGFEPIVYLDCIVLKVRHNSCVINKSVFLALGINIEGQKELLGMWLAENEGAKFWLNVLTELKNRGLNDIVVDHKIRTPG